MKIITVADRIQARAIRRCGELLKQIGNDEGGRPNKNHGANDIVFSRTAAATQAGLSERQKVTALRVATSQTFTPVHPHAHGSASADLRWHCETEVHPRARGSAIEIGRELTEVKAELPHGQFLPWIAAEFEMERQTASNFMSVYEKFGDGKFPIIGNFKPTILYALSAPSTPDSVIEKAIEQGAAGEKVTVADVKQWKEAARIAGITPPIIITDIDPKLAVHRSNNQNRDATPGQKAMAFAMQFPEGTNKGGRGKTSILDIEVGSPTRAREADQGYSDCEYPFHGSPTRAREAASGFQPPQIWVGSPTRAREAEHS